MSEASKNIGSTFKIKAVHKGKFAGYIKKINYENGVVKLTNNKELALKHTSEDEVHSDIDFLTKYYFESGYTFTY